MTSPQARGRLVLLAGAPRRNLVQHLGFCGGAYTVSREHNASGEAQATERENDGVGCSQKIGAVNGED